MTAAQTQEKALLAEAKQRKLVSDTEALVYYYDEILKDDPGQSLPPSRARDLTARERAEMVARVKGVLEQLKAEKAKAGSGG